MKKTFQALIASFALLLSIQAAIAQNASFGLSPNSTAAQSISVTNSSSTITLANTIGSTVVIFNTGSTVAYVTTTATATTTGFPIPGGYAVTFNFPPGGRISAITGGTDTTTLLVGKGSGATSITGGGGGGGGLPAGASTSANQSTEITALNSIVTNTGGSIPAGTAIIGKVTTDQTTPGTTDLVHLPTTSNGGATTVKGGVGVVNGGSTYQAVAASQTATVLQTSTGAAGDYLSHCVIYPTSTSPGVVTVFDNTNTAATSAILFAGGATSTSNLTPISVPVGAVSTAGAWKVTTGAAVSVVCFGKFS